MCRSLIVKKSLCTDFGTSRSDADATLKLKTSIFQSLNTDEGFGFQNKNASLQFLQMLELRNVSAKLPAIKETSRIFFFL